MVIGMYGMHARMATRWRLSTPMLKWYVLC